MPGNRRRLSRVPLRAHGGTKPTDESPPLTEVRLDVWLDVSCLFPTRSQAAAACAGGKVDLNGHAAAAHKLVRAGDRLEITFPGGRRTFLVKGLAERHVPKAAARALYEETTPPLAPQVLEARRLERLLAPAGRRRRTSDEEGTAAAGEGARVVRRLGRLRPYEILLLADFVAVVLLLRLRARLGLDVVRTLLDTRNFIWYAAQFLLGGILLRALLAARRGRWRGVARLRAFLKPRSLVDLARLLVAMPLTSYVYSWLKVALPLLRPDVLYDRGLYRLETALHFGVNPGRLLQGLFPYPSLWRVLDHYYGAFILTVMAGLGWFAATLSIRDRARFAAGFALLWVIGIVDLSRGPVPRALLRPQGRLHERPRLDAVAVGGDGPPARAVRAGALVPPPARRARTSRRTSASPRCRPSTSGRRHSSCSSRAGVRGSLFLLFAFLTALTLFTSVVSGWHYAIDGYAALLLAWVAFEAGSRSVPNA